MKHHVIGSTLTRYLVELSRQGYRVVGPSGKEATVAEMLDVWDNINPNTYDTRRQVEDAVQLCLDSGQSPPASWADELMDEEEPLRRSRHNLDQSHIDRDNLDYQHKGVDPLWED